MMYGIDRTKVESKRIEIRPKLVEYEIRSKLVEYEMTEPVNLTVETTKYELRGFLQALDWLDL